MNKAWLKSNHRVIVAGLVIASMVVAIGLLLVALANRYNLGIWISAGGGIVVAIGVIFFVAIAFHLRKPRIGYCDGNILFFLRRGTPIVMPVEVVEAFFLGQGDSHLAGKAGQAKTVNLVARIAERFAEWQRVDVHPQLANWRDGYVTIHGTWTEPLSEDLVRSINHKLVQAKRSRVSG